jgi:hypothetical protein
MSPKGRSPRKKRAKPNRRPSKQNNRPSPESVNEPDLATIIQRAKHRPDSLSQGDLLSLQRSAGNQIVQQLVEKNKAIQPPSTGKTKQSNPGIYRSRPDTLNQDNVLRQEVESPVSAVAQDVWDNHSAIHAHFGNDVNEFARQTQEQWESTPSVRHHFNGLDAERLGYRRIYPSYFSLGITNPADWIRDNIRFISFLSHHVSVHQDLVGSLQTVERNIQNDPGLGASDSGGILKIGGYVPRHIRGSTALSHHALGRAVDINSDTNLRFLDLVGHSGVRVRRLLKIIKAVTGVDLDTVTDFKTQRQASLDFQAGFDTWHENQKTWLNDFLKGRLETNKQLLKERRAELRKYRGDKAGKAALKDDVAEMKSAVVEAKAAVKEQKKLLKEVKSVRQATKKLTTTGFLDLDGRLVKIFQDEGFKWGGEWSGEKKDYMHFQSGSASP